jgi:hypothetical protein
MERKDFKVTITLNGIYFFFFPTPKGGKRSKFLVHKLKNTLKPSRGGE